MNKVCKRYGHAPDFMSLLLKDLFGGKPMSEKNAGAIRPCDRCGEMFSPQEDDRRLSDRRKRQSKLHAFAIAFLASFAMVLVIVAVMTS